MQVICRLLARTFGGLGVEGERKRGAICREDEESHGVAWTQADGVRCALAGFTMFKVPKPRMIPGTSLIVSSKASVDACTQPRALGIPFPFPLWVVIYLCGCVCVYMLCCSAHQSTCQSDADNLLLP